MKTIHWLATLLIGGLAMNACTSEPKVPEGEFLIEGHLENVPDSTVIGLFKVTGLSGKSIAYDTVIGGRFSFRDTITTTPRKMIITASSFFNPGKGFPNAALTVWVASGAYIRVEGKDHLIRTWETQSRIPEQQAAEAFRKIAFPEDRTNLQYSAEQEALRHAGRTEENRRKYRMLQDKRDSLNRLIDLRKLNYMKTAPMSATWLDEYRSMTSCYLLHKPDKELGTLVRSLAGRMSEAGPDAECYGEIMSYLNLPEQLAQEGGELIDGDLYDLNGNLHHLSEFKGKYILLDFWDKGCGPCMVSFPETEEICRQYKDKLEVVGICIGTPEAMKEVLSEHKPAGHQWRQLASGTGGLVAIYRVNSIPHYVLISPEGEIIRMWKGYSKGSLKEKMKELVK